MIARERGAVALAVLVIGGMACGGGAGGNDNNPPPPLQSAVAVSNNLFTPRVDSILRTGTVTWTWVTGSVDHNVIPTGATTFTGKGTATVPGTPDVDYFDQGTTHQFTFNTAGQYKYYCSTHGTAASPDIPGQMGGIIVVVP